MRQLNLCRTIKNIKCMYDACRLDRSNVTTVPYLFTCSLFCLHTVGLYISALAHGIDGVLEPYRQALVTIEEQVHIHTHMWPYMHKPPICHKLMFCRIRVARKEFEIGILPILRLQWRCCDDPPSHTEEILSSCAQAFCGNETAFIMEWMRLP